MKQKHLEFNQKEDYDLISHELDEIEVLMTEFLEGFDRRIMKAWTTKGLWN